MRLRAFLGVHWRWAAWTIGLTLVFGRVAAYNLGNYRPVSNDEVELMAVAYKLARQGVVGSDLYAGFASADQHFLITLPLQHFLAALSFRLFEPGVAQARWVSVVAGASIPWTVGWLAYRWYGLGTAVVCGVLLVLWPSNLTAAPNGLPLLGVTRAARYDVLAVAFTSSALVLLDMLLRQPNRVVGLGLGMACGLAALAQFIGAFALPVVVVNWLWARGRRGLAEPTLYWVLAGTAVAVLPWVVFVAQYHADLALQLTVYGDRWDVLSPSFYLGNIQAEGARYQGVLSVPASADDPAAPNSLASQLLMAVAVWPAVAYIAVRSARAREPGRTGEPGDRLLLSTLVIFGSLLVLFDRTKTPLYAIILLPSVCVATAALATVIWRSAMRTQRWRGWVTRAIVVGLGVLVANDGLRAYQGYLTQAALASQYLGVGAQLESALTPGARILGPERWWWALHDHPYASLHSVWWQWLAQSSAGPQPEFAAWVTSTQADAVIVNDNIRDDIHAFPEPLQQQFWAFVNSCTTPVLDLTDTSYFRIEVDRITRPPPALEICGGHA